MWMWLLGTWIYGGFGCGGGTVGLDGLGGLFLLKNPMILWLLHLLKQLPLGTGALLWEEGVDFLPWEPQQEPVDTTEWH